MIDKIKKGKYFKGAFLYNLQKVNEGKAAFLYAFGFTKTNPTYNEMCNEFIQISEKTRVKNPVFHTSLNFPEEDQLDNLTMEAIAREYLEKMGYGDTPYVMFRHYDAGHPHLHIISANIEFRNGKWKGIDTFNDYKKGNKVCADIEKQYGLKISVTSEGKNKEISKNFSVKRPEKQDYGKGPTFDYLRDVVNYVTTNCFFTNLKQLNQQLHAWGIMGFRSVSRSGVPYFKFTFKKEMKTVGVGGTSRQLRLHKNDFKIEELFRSNHKKYESINTPELHHYVRSLLKDYISISEKELLTKLFQKDILYKKSNEYYCKNIDCLFTPEAFNIPQGFVQHVTVRKEWIKTFFSIVQAYKKDQSVFHLSTLLKNEKLLSGLRLYAVQKMKPMAEEKVNVLFKVFCKYNCARISQIEEQEKEKDIKWVSKVIDYANKLSISYYDKLFLLQQLGIKITQQNILVSNNTDKIINHIDSGCVPVLMGDRMPGRYEKKIASFTLSQWWLIKACIYGKKISGLVEPDMMPFLIGEEHLTLSSVKEYSGTSQPVIFRQDLFSELLKNLVAQQPSHFKKFQKRDENEDWDEEEIRRNRIRRQRM